MSAQQKSEAAIVADATRYGSPTQANAVVESLDAVFSPQENDFCDRTNIRVDGPRKQVPHSCVCGCGKIARVCELVGQIR